MNMNKILCFTALLIKFESCDNAKKWEWFCFRHSRQYLWFLLGFKLSTS